MMDHKQKLDFVLKMTQHALQSVQHFDTGGTVLQGPQQVGTPNAAKPGRSGIAGAIGDVLGTNNNFQATPATITPGTNTAQLNEAYNGVQGALKNAGNLTQTLQPGITQGAQTQNQLTGLLQGRANGQGVSPARAALNEQTGRNINRSNALAAGVRGAGSNAGLIANQAANQAAETQQQAVGQAATLQTNEQIAAQNQLQNLAAQQIGQGTNAVGLESQVQQGEQGILQGANAAFNNGTISSQNNVNAVNAGVSGGNQNAAQNTIGFLGNAINSGGKYFGLFAEGGEVPEHLMHMARVYHPHLFEGGSANIPKLYPIQETSLNMPAYEGDFGKPIKDNIFGSPTKNERKVTYATEPVRTTENRAYGGKTYKEGGKVPGKESDHDDYDKDTVTAKLSPGEVVIDIDTLKAKGKLGEMARFVANNIARKNAGRKL